MYYIKGKVIRLDGERIVVEDQNGIAYQGINVAEKEVTITSTIDSQDIFYCMQYWNEFELNYLFFHSEALRNIFENLLKIKQVGIKTAQAIFQLYSVDEFLRIIKNYEPSELQKVKGLGSLTAKIIIDELNKVMFNQKMTQKQEKVLFTLQRLGYKLTSVYRVLKEVDRKLPEEQLLSTSIRMLSENEFQ